MSSDGEKDNNQGPTKRKGNRPCDMCRRKKRRCDGGEPCGRCVKHEFSCTYQQRAMPRVASSRYVRNKSGLYHVENRSYVQSLETRLKTVEGLLRESNVTLGTDSPDSAPEKSQEDGLGLITRAIRGLNSPFPAPYSDDLTFLDVADSLGSLSLTNTSNHGFQGKSSQAMLVKTAVDFWLRTDPSAISRPMLDPPSAKPWRLMPWDNSPPAMNYTFPPRDLLMRLVALYFSNVNIFFPVLHRPTFEKTLASHAHLSDDSFAKTVLLVCALGARYSDDPRVHLPTTPLGTAGWVWYDQVKLIVSGQPTLTGLQNYCLSVQFLDRTSGPRAAWTVVGFGIRLGQDIGAHRLKLRKRTISSEEELEKRAYWTLVLFDAQLSGALGRSIAIQSHDFDLDQPSPVDDEYWEPSLHNPAFSQPPDKPSLIDFFNCQLNLNRILSFTLKVFYSTNRSRSIIGVAEDSWEKLVMEFDSALNTWRDSVPAHLRWNQGRQTDDVFFDQAAALACNYHLTQILIHRPFIPAVKSSAGRPQCDPSLMSQCFPSLTICHNAARACSHVAEIHHRRRPNNPLPFAQTAVFTSGIVLLLSIWGGHRAGGAQDADFSDVHRCLSVLRAYNERWPSAGPLLDTLEQLLKVDHALPRGAAAASHELPSPDKSSGSSHGTPSSLPPLQRDTDLGVPSSSAGQGWPAFDPVLEIFGDSYMLNHHYGPGEAPAHAPHVVPGGLRYHDPSAGTGTTPYADTSAYQSSWSFPAPPGDTQHRPHTYDTVAIWSAAPSGFEASDWDSYLNSMGT